MRQVRHIVLYTVAIVLIAVGLVVLPLPIPFGLIMIAAGLGILITVNDNVAHTCRKVRLRHVLIDRFLVSAEHRLPDSLATVIRRSSPHGQAQHNGVDDAS